MSYRAVLPQGNSYIFKTNTKPQVKLALQRFLITKIQNALKNTRNFLDDLSYTRSHAFMILLKAQ
jgi:hypothetical protein